MSNLVALNDIPTLAILYKLRRLTAPSTTPRASASQPYNAKIALIRSDLTTLKVDAIVNAANTSLMGGGGVDGAIHRAAGPALVKECETLNGCETGSAKITGAYNLPCKNVIHAVGPVYSTTKQKGTHATLLRGCYRRSLELAVENNLQSIAFAALSTGIYGYPSDEAAETAISEVRTFLDSGKGDSLDRIVFCNFMPKDMAAYHDWLPWFFPPTEADLGPEGSDLSSLESSKPLQKQLSDPPKSEPGFEEAPDAKKQKREHYPAADSEDNIENECKNESGDVACQ